MKRHALVTAIALIATPALTALISPQVSAEHSDLPEIEVKGSYTTIDFSYTRNSEQLQQPDSAALLRTIPGANINRNGPLTGIAQYRGSYGERVNVSIDGAQFVSGGPNAMDTPLSYVPSGLLDELRVSRGIASVSDGQQTLGGHIAVTSQRGAFNTDSDFETHATLKSSYTGNNSGTSNSALAYIANQNHKLGVNLSYDHGQDTHFDSDDTLENTFYERARYNLFYGYESEQSGFNLSLGPNETDDSGTPALPMDILYIDSDLASADFYTQLGDTRIEGSLSYSHADHGMDNVSHRTPPNMTMMMMGMPMTMAMNRDTHATGRKLAYKLQLTTPIAGGELTLGMDNSQTVHNAVVTNPTNALFEVHNFNDAEQEIAGLYGEWEVSSDQWTLEAGLRHNRIDSDADAVNATGFSTMPMTMGGPSMSDVISGLATGVNNSDLSNTENNLDAVIKLAYHLSPEVTLGAGLAQKNRAPSYQERYLWLPLQTTGGLADGRNYIGNLALDSETAHELNLGIDWRTKRGYLSLQGFYRDVNDYIQGTAVSSMDNMAANMVSNMMGSQDALQFNNVDAKLYGADLGYGVQLSSSFRRDGTLSYVRGKRTDTSDDLYRIAPLNHRLSLSYQGDEYSLALESELYAKQNQVSDYNSEEKTAGYGLMHLRGQTQLGEHFSVSAGIENLLDHKHQNHLAGYNRVQGSDVASGERLYGAGRNAYLNLSYSF